MKSGKVIGIEKKEQSKRRYCTMEDKIDMICERIYQAAFDEFDNIHTEEEIEQMDEDDTYFENAYQQKVWVKGYENYTVYDIGLLPYKDIIKIYNYIYEENLTVESVRNDKLYWNGCSSTEVEK